MIPHSHSYAEDMQAKSRELADTIAAALSAAQISAACAAVESYLTKQTRDQHRWFFSITFPTLICRIFGFDEASHSAAQRRAGMNGWIDVAISENDSELAGKIFSLLSPNGVLLSSIHGVDRLSLVKYVFPLERLPEWVQYMLKNEGDYSVMANLCPMLRNRIKEDINKNYSYQVHLNLFEYFLFWFAYYPVCRGNSEGAESVKVQRPKRFKFESWTNSLQSFSSAKRGVEKKDESNLYLRLLYAYLCAFVPVIDENMLQAYQGSLLHHSSCNSSYSIERTEFVVHTFMNFWLLDKDFSPLPVGVCKSFHVTSPLISALGETPPTLRLSDVVNVFLKYLNLISFQTMADSNQLNGVGSTGCKVSAPFDVAKSRGVVPSIHSVGSWVSLTQRPLYRFILRTFLFSPAETSITNASQTFSLWINYMEPWLNKFEKFPDLDELLEISNTNSVNDVEKSSSPGYSSMWQGYVLSNYLFYSSLVMHFIGFAHKFLHTDTDAIVRMVMKVMSILTHSTELMSLLKNIDAVYHSKAKEISKSAIVMLNSYVPRIGEQLQDWEYGLCENDADGSFLHANWNKDLRLFSDGEDGGQHLLQLFLLRAESELQSISGNSLIQSLQSLNSQLNMLFGSPVTVPSFETSESRYYRQPCQEIFKPRSFGNQIPIAVKYKGDSMKRPISDDEISWLAKLLVNLSCWVNESLGLNQVNHSLGSNDWLYVEVPNGLRTVHGSTETMKVVTCSLLSWIVWLGGAGVQYMRDHGLRVNLRMPASKKVMVMVLGFTVYSILRKALAL